MSSETPRLNQIGMPPPGRSIQARRAQDDADADGGEPADFRQQLILSIIAFVAVLLVSLGVAWLVL